MAAYFKISNDTLNIGQLEEIIFRTLNYVDYVNKHYFFNWLAGKCVMQSILQHSFFTLMDMFCLKTTWNSFDLQKLILIYHSVYKIPKKNLLGNNIHQIYI